MIAFQLWMGVVFLIGGGVFFLFNLRHYLRGRYFVEMHSEGFEKGFWESLRWLWAIVWALSAIFFFFCAGWLIKYILTTNIAGN